MVEDVAVPLYDVRSRQGLGSIRDDHLNAVQAAFFEMRERGVPPALSSLTVSLTPIATSSETLASRQPNYA